MKIIGHRGASTFAPENTIASFKKAIEHKVDMIELDVQQSADGVAVVHHDPYVTDPSGAHLEIADTTYANLLRHKPDMPALDMVIREVAHQCVIIIEIKPGVNPAKTIEIIRYYLSKGWQLNEFAIASFDFQILQKVKSALPDITLIVNESWSGVRASYRARRLGTKRLAMNQRWLWRGFLRSMEKGGYRLSPYTVNNPAQARRWSKYLYAIYTDRPELFKK